MDDKPKNIFDASNKSGKPQPIKGPLTPQPQKKEIPSSPPESIGPDLKELLNLHPDPEINVMFNKMYQMRDEILTKLATIYESAGLTTAQVKNYLDNPNNFPPETWQRIQSERDILEKKVSEVLKIYGKKKKKGLISGLKGVGDSKERKSKTLGSRRNWIPM